MSSINASYGVTPAFLPRHLHEENSENRDGQTKQEIPAINQITGVDRRQSNRRVDYRHQDRATEQKRAEDEAITRRSERRIGDEWHTAALDRLRYLAARNGAAIPPVALAAAQAHTPLIQENDLQSGTPGSEFAFDVHSEYFVVRQRSGELSVEPEIRAGRAIEGIIGTFSPLRLDLPTDLLLRRESQRNSAFSDKIAEIYRQFTEQENQITDQQNSIERLENQDQIRQEDAREAIEVSTQVLSARDSAPPQLPVIADEGPDFSDQAPARHNPLNRLGQLINIAA